MRTWPGQRAGSMKREKSSKKGYEVGKFDKRSSARCLLWRDTLRSKSSAVPFTCHHL